MFILLDCLVRLKNKYRDKFMATCITYNQIEHVTVKNVLKIITFLYIFTFISKFKTSQMNLSSEAILFNLKKCLLEYALKHRIDSIVTCNTFYLLF